MLSSLDIKIFKKGCECIMFTNALKDINNFLTKIGVVNYTLKGSDFQGMFVKRLSNSNLLGEDKKDIKDDGTRNHQTHLDITGQENINFFFLQGEQNLYTSGTDVSKNINVNLVSNNIEYLDMINVQKTGLSYQKSGRTYKTVERQAYNFLMGNIHNTTLIRGKAIKKLRHGAMPQVQINTPDSNDEFNKLRKRTYKNDVLILLKQDEYSFWAIVIPKEDISDFRSLQFKNANTVLTNNKGINISTNTVISENDCEYMEKCQGNRKVLRMVTSTTIASTNFNSDEEDDDTKNGMTDLSSGIEIRKKRTERHQDIVRRLAEILEKSQFKIYENPIDCMGIRDESLVLIFEVKTLDGSRTDEKKQVTKAFAQLYFYEEFEKAEFDCIQSQKIAVFEGKIQEDYIQFLQKNNILVLWMNEHRKFDGTLEALTFLDKLFLI